ncbi:MAG: glycosyltransferase family 2 protein [Algoriphagus sp.]|nr:glycosyltransferase family 2 protein [Algoriphagus sp.]
MDHLNSLCSVALCTFNGEKYLSELLDSILSQSVPANEIIIVDDCSSDGTLEILKEYAEKNSEIKLYPQNSNSGPIASFEKAIQLTSYPYIFLADQDDVWKPTKIETMLSFGSNCSEDQPLLVYSDLEVIDENGEILFPSFWKMAGLKPQISTFRSLFFGNSVTGCASMINSKMKEYLVSIPQGVLMHDHWIGLIAYGFGSVVVLDDPLLKYRTHGKSVTEKVQANLLWKFRTQMNQIFNLSSDFLGKEIDQIILFNQKFRSYLSKENQKHVDTFSALKHKSMFKRKLVSYLRNIKGTK